MAGITAAQAEARLEEYLAAEAAILTNQSYSIGDRTFTRADLGKIQEGIKLWDSRAKALALNAAGRGRARTVCPGW